MIVSDAVDQVLIQLEQTEEEEYDADQARFHVGQAVRELAEDAESKFDRQMTTFSLAAPEPDAEPEYWQSVPGRAPITSVLGVSWEQFGYIKKAWVDNSGTQQPFHEYDLRELIDKFGDSEGEPEGYAVDGDYIYWRPIPEYESGYTARFNWVKLPQAIIPDSAQPRLLDVAPFAVIYKACMLASIFLNEDQRVIMFETLASKAWDRFVLMHSITGDSRRDTEMFDG